MSLQPVSTVRVERAEQAILLREAGWLLADIAAELGISRSYASSLVSDPTGSGDRQRKRSYGRLCANGCGRVTDGSNGRNNAPLYCMHCFSGCTQRKWTRDNVIEAIREWARRRGSAPTATDWITRTVDPDGYEFPPRAAVYDSHNGTVHPLFDHWADAIEAAGFPHPRSDRNYNPDPWKVENMSDTRITRPYLILKVLDDGELAVIGTCDSHTTTAALEATISTPGRYKVVAMASLTEYNLQPKLVAAAVTPTK